MISVFKPDARSAETFNLPECSYGSIKLLAAAVLPYRVTAEGSEDGAVLRALIHSA
jgi:hypothetical protein